MCRLHRKGKNGEIKTHAEGQGSVLYSLAVAFVSPRNGHKGSLHHFILYLFT
jgi:hypothetical protein